MFIIVLEFVNLFHPVFPKITEIQQFSFFIYTQIKTILRFCSMRCIWNSVTFQTIQKL